MYAQTRFLPPRFDFDESRSYFRVTLPVQEGFAGLRGFERGGNGVAREPENGFQVRRCCGTLNSALKIMRYPFLAFSAYQTIRPRN